MIITIDKIRNWLWNLFWVGKTHRHVPIRKKKHASMFSQNFQVFPDSHLSRISPTETAVSGKPWRLIITVRKLGFWDQASGSKILRFSSHVWWHRKKFQAIQSNSGFQGISMNWRGGTVAFFWKPFPLVENLTSSGWWFQPLWQIWKSVGMMTFQIDGKIKVMFQTTNQSFFISCSSPRGLFLSPRREQYSEDHPGSSKWLVTLITLVSKSPFMGLPHIYNIWSFSLSIYIYICISDYGIVCQLTSYVRSVTTLQVPTARPPVDIGRHPSTPVASSWASACWRATLLDDL